MSKFHANIFLIATTLNYFCSSAVFENWSFENQLFLSYQIAKWDNTEEDERK
jgi:hypothetical protein